MKAFNKVGVESNIVFCWGKDQIEAMRMELIDFINTTASSADNQGKSYIPAAKELCDIFKDAILSNKPVALPPVAVNNLITIFSYDSMVQRAMTDSIGDFINTQYAPMIEHAAEEQEDKFKVYKDEIIKASNFALDFNKSLIAYIKNPKSKKAKLVADALKEDPKHLDAMSSGIEKALEWNIKELENAYDENPLKDIPKFDVQYGGVASGNNPFTDEEDAPIDDVVDEFTHILSSMIFNSMMHQNGQNKGGQSPEDDD